MENVDQAVRPLILATRNAGKVRELAGPLARVGFAVRGVPPEMPDVGESGATFEENALLKARATAAWTGLPALADDSGLEVDALGGEPGVHSARYADDEAPAPDSKSDAAGRDARNTRKLLARMEGRRARSARFRCCMALVFPDGRPDIVVNGAWEGLIAEDPRGDGGFGYDPVFCDPASGRTAAELSPEEKMARSHRGAALRHLLEALAAAPERV